MPIRDLLAYFYANDGMFASTQPKRLQRAFGVLADLFNRVGFRTNTWRMVSMGCHPFHVPVRMLVEVHERQTTGTGPKFW